MTIEYQKNPDKSKNIEAIKAAGLKPDLSKGDEKVLCFREKGKPMVNYWPSTNHWQIVGEEKTVSFHGPVEQFIEWYMNLSTESGDAI